MELFPASVGRVCNNCNNRDEERVFTLQYGYDVTSKNTICLCITCLEDMGRMIDQIGIFK